MKLTRIWDGWKYQATGSATLASYTKRHPINCIDLQNAANGSALVIVRWRNGCVWSFRTVDWSEGWYKAWRLCRNYGARLFVNSREVFPDAKLFTQVNALTDIARALRVAPKQYYVQGTDRLGCRVSRTFTVKRTAERYLRAVMKGVS